MINIKDLWFRLRYKKDTVYTVPIDKIIIQPSFKKTMIRREKWLKKANFYKKYRKFESQIVLDKNFVLRDGYSTYKLAKRMEFTEVQVVFEM